MMISKGYLALVALLLAGAPLMLAQTHGCIGVNHVGAFPDKPFTGEFRTTESTANSGNSYPFKELVARDREGRMPRTILFCAGAAYNHPHDARRHGA